MKALYSIALLCTSALFVSACSAGSYQSGGYRTSQAPGYYQPQPRVYVVQQPTRPQSAVYYQSGPVTIVQQRPHQSQYSVGVRSPQAGYNSGNQTYNPRRQQQRPDRRYEQRPSQRSDRHYHQHPQHNRNPAVQQGNPRAGENQFGSGNTQMPRPPQMNQPGPAQGQQQHQRPPQQQHQRGQRYR